MQLKLRTVLSVLFAVFMMATPASAQVLTDSRPVTITTADTDCEPATSCAIVRDMRNLPSIGVYVDVGTSGTFEFEAAIQDGVWFSVTDDVNDSSSLTADGARFFTNPGYRQFRVRASALSGDAQVYLVKGFAGMKSTATLSGAAQGDGSLQDGANSAIEATVVDLASSNPLAIVCADATTGALQSCATGGAGGGGAAQADNTALGDLTGAGALYDTTAPAITDGNVGAFRMDSDRVLFMKPFTGVTFASTQSGAWTVTANLSATDNAVLDDIADGIAVTNAGTFATQATQAGTWSTRLQDGAGNAITSATAGSTQPLDVIIVGTDGTRFNPAVDAAHGSAGGSEGPQTMVEAAVDVSANTPVTDGDAVRLSADNIGRLLVAGACDRSARVRAVTTVTDGSSTSAIAAQGAGILTEVWDVIIANTSASSVTVDIRDGTAGSVLATFPVPGNTAGVVHRFSVPLTGTANTAIAVDPSAAVSSIITTLVGCKVK